MDDQTIFLSIKTQKEHCPTLKQDIIDLAVSEFAPKI